MSTVQEIEAAIRSLSPADRQQLAENLPALVPELDGDAWIWICSHKEFDRRFPG